MIKLKQLIEGNVPTYKWETPDGTPDDVIKVFHYIVAALLKQGKNPEQFIKLYHNSDEKNHPQMKKDYWILVKMDRVADSLYYDADTRIWNSHLGAYKFEPLNSSELKMAIQNWILD